MDDAHPDVVAVLTRASSAGGKTRLFAALAIPGDRSLLDALLLDTLDGVATAGVRRTVAVTPSSAQAEVASLVGEIPVIAQPDGSLGDRMGGTMRALFAAGARRVAIVGSDLPQITSEQIAAAFARLEEDRTAIVLGPAIDGGYYLIAACDVPPVFDNIEWGSSRVLEQTLAEAARQSRPVHLLAALGDVDTVEDLWRVERTASRSRTAAWVRQHLAE